MDNEKIGSFIRELRKERGLTQRDLADALHITDRAVSKWERGLNAPDIALLEPLSELLGVSVGELIRGRRDREEETPMDETKSVLDYSKGEISRKVRGERKRYIAVLAVLLLLAGALLWRSGMFFLLDKKVSPDGQRVVRVYNREWSSWPLGFTGREAVQFFETDREGRTIGGSCFLNDCDYQGLWWAPDSRRYLLELEWQGEQYFLLNGHASLTPFLNNLGGLGAEYQFLQWGKDGESILFYYRTESRGDPKEGYFWYNCRTGRFGGELELPTVWEWGEKP